MTRKDLKLSATSQGLPEKFDLWEELEDKNGEKISGGAIFRFVNQGDQPIDVNLMNGIQQDLIVINSRPFIVDPSNQARTEIVSMLNEQITVFYDSTLGSGDRAQSENMNSDQRGIFNLEGNNNIIVFVVE